MRRTSKLTSALIPLALAACGEDPAGNGLTKKDAALIVLEARLASSTTKAGESVGVECIGTYDDRSTKSLSPPDIKFEIAPEADGSQIVDGEILIERSGVYEIRCTNTVASEIKPATLTVLAAVPAKAIAQLDRASISSGERVTASCRIEDEDGNLVEGAIATYSAQPAAGLNWNGTQIEGVAAGSYQIFCEASGFDAVQVPATLTVNAGQAANIVVSIADTSVFAGDRVDVACLVTDANDNPLMVETAFEVTPLVTMTDIAGFTPTVVGSYEIVCSVPSTGLTSQPLAMTVAAGLPSRIVINEVVPQKTVYLLSEVVELRARITDAWDNEVLTAQYEATSNPPTSTRFAGRHNIELAVEGAIEAVARVTTPTEGGQEVSASVTLLTDGSPPDVRFDFPARGEIVAGPNGSNITIIGQTTDLLSAVTSMTIGNQPVALDAQGNFQMTFPTNWGINLIEGTVADAAGNSRGFAQSFEYSEYYRRAGDNRISTGRLGDALAVYIGQAVLDDNNSDVDDLATIARLAIQQADLNALIPDPATNYHSDCSVWFVTITGDLRLWVDDVRFGTPIIDITAINGGLRLRAEIPNLHVDLHTTGDVCDVGIGVSGNATATRAVITGDILISRSGTNINVTMPTASVQLTGFGLDLEFPSIIDWAIDGIISLFHGVIADELEDALVDVIRGEVPPVVDDFLSSVALDTQLALPAPLSLTLGVDSRLGMVDFATGRGQLGFDTTIYATGTISPEPLGGILQDGRPFPQFSGARAFGVGVAYDLINQALYSAWYGGALDLDLAQFIPGNLSNNGNPVTLEAVAHGLLPPVIVPTNDPQWPIELQIGDLELTVNLDGVPGFPNVNATIYATAYAQANASINAQGQIVLTMAPNPYLALDYMTNLPGVDLAQFTGTLEQTVGQFLPDLFNQVIGGIPIPSFDLSAMAGNFLPPNIVLGIGNANAAYHPAYLVLEGDIVQAP